jgi:hypothetical protein
MPLRQILTPTGGGAIQIELGRIATLKKGMGLLKPLPASDGEHVGVSRSEAEDDWDCCGSAKGVKPELAVRKTDVGSAKMVGCP